MHILHGINYDSPHDLDVLEASNQANGATLHQDIALGEQFQSFESVSIRSNQPLSTFDESLLIPYVGPTSIRRYLILMTSLMTLSSITLNACW